MRCSPGDMCVIVGEDPGCEENIGALLTVIEPYGPTRPTAWTFKDASRLVKVIDDEDGGRTPYYVTRSDERPDGLCSIDDRFLVPIRGLPDAEEEAAGDSAPAHHTHKEGAPAC